MKNVTITLDDQVAADARVQAAQEGKSLSRFVTELVQQRVGRKLTQKEAIERYLAGPQMDLTDENGKAPTRDQIYDRPS